VKNIKLSNNQGSRAQLVPKAVRIRYLVDLGLVKCVGRGVENARRVHPSFIEEKLVHIIAEVIMLIDVLARPLNGVGTREMRHRLELCPDPICNAEVRLGGIHGGDILCANADKPREVIRVVIPKHVALAQANVSVLCNTGEE